MVEGAVERHGGDAEGSAGTPFLAVPGQHADLAVLAGRLQAGDRSARTFTVERVALGGASHAAATAAVEGFNTLQHRIGTGHGEAPARWWLSAINSWRPSMLPVPPILIHWLGPVAAFFTKTTWDRVLVLATGAVLAPRQRTVTAVLSVLGRRDGMDFARFHGVLNRARWSGRSLARALLRWLVAVFVPDGPVVVGIDETIERRWGPKISARGIDRDPVRSSRGHFVKASGLRWVSVMLLAPVPWAGRIWGLPFLTALAPSERFARQVGRRHKPLADWGRQLLPLAAWSPAHCRGRHHLCRYRTARRGASQADHGHPSAPGRPAVRSATAAPARHQRPPSSHRPAPADPRAASR